MNNYLNAIKCLDEALSIDPDDEKIWEAYRKAKSLLRSSGPKEKQEIITQQSDASLKNEISDDVFSLNDKGLSLYDQGKYQDAIQYYDKALEIDPNFVSTLNNRASVLCKLHKYKDAIEDYDKALKIDPNNESVRYDRFVAVQELSKIQELSEEKRDDTIQLQRNQNITEDVKVLNEKGNELYNQRKYTEALECFDKALQLVPNDEEVIYNRFRTLESLTKEKSSEGPSQDGYLNIVKPDKREATFNIYSKVKIKAKELSEEIVSYLEQRGFKVNLRSDPTYNTYSIQASKSSKLTRIVGISKSVNIILRGTSQNLEIALSTGEFKKNLISQVAISAPFSAATLGIPTAAAVGTTVLTTKKFKHDLWKFIHTKIT